MRCDRHHWFYDRGRLGRVEIVTHGVFARAPAPSKHGDYANTNTRVANKDARCAGYDTEPPSYHIIRSSLDRILNCFLQVIHTLIFGSRWKHHDRFKLFANTLESLGRAFSQGTDVSTVAWSTVTCRFLQFTVFSSLGRYTVALVWTRSVGACAIVKTRIYEKLVPQSVLSSTSCKRARFETL